MILNVFFLTFSKLHVVYSSVGLFIFIAIQHNLLINNLVSFNHICFLWYLASQVSIMLLLSCYYVMLLCYVIMLLSCYYYHVIVFVNLSLSKLEDSLHDKAPDKCRFINTVT